MKPIDSIKYESNVFINCPFDEAYKSMFDAILFAICSCNFIPRCALEYGDSSDIRIKKIIALIRDCKYAVHDLSRFHGSSGLSRFNMPLELGIFVGCQEFGSTLHKQKRYLVLEDQPFQSLEFISDLRGQDLSAHRSNPQQAMKHIRDWLAKASKQHIVGIEKMWKQYEHFCDELPELCKPLHWTVPNLLFTEYVGLAQSWLAQQQSLEK
jgi:hypothetical protein